MGFTSEIINTDINACTDYSQSKSQMRMFDVVILHHEIIQFP